METLELTESEKQMLCFIRAILRQNKIVVFDEMTSNMDLETQDLLLSKLDDSFKDCTLICIAHRLSTVANFDKIIVLEFGEIALFDEPFKLLVKNENDTNIT